MSQNKEILSFMRRGQKITPLAALNYFGSLRLAARINYLRSKGNEIEDEWYNTASGKRVKRYFMQIN